MDVIEVLKGKDNTSAYQLLLVLEEASRASDELYSLFDDFYNLTRDQRSFVRVRGFRLCCAQARWDREGKLEERIGEMMDTLRDEKPTGVRQCLAALGPALAAKPDLRKPIAEGLKALDLSKYRDSMRPLIEKDISALLDAPL